jgi:cell division inhibitor SepF
LEHVIIHLNFKEDTVSQMKIVDKICEIFGLYGEEDDIELLEGENPKEENNVVPMFGSKKWGDRTPAVKKEHSFFGSRRNASDDKVISMPLTSKQVKVIVIEPTSFDDAQVIADYLRKNQPVVINFEDTDPDTAKRIIDFVSGTIYALNGSLRKIGRSILVCAPQNVDIDAAKTSYTDRSDNPWQK